VDEHQSPNWYKGILRPWVREGFQNLLMAIQNFMTCEGRYGITLLYHMWFLLHFYGNQPLNIPFFFLKSLIKMASKVQSHPTFLDSSLLHHCLIKLLVEDHLKTQERTWDRFLFQCGFSTEEPIESVPDQTPSRRHRCLILGGSSGYSTPSP
jgi:hypothetical protein